MTGIPLLASYFKEHLKEAFDQQKIVVISPDIAYHDKDAAFKTLLGQRAWDLMRCVDYLSSLDTVAPARVGCAGLSLGGEMALWLGALDTRVAATEYQYSLSDVDSAELATQATRLTEALRKRPELADVDNNLANQGRALELHVDREKASTLGVPMQTIDADLQADNPGTWMLHCHNIYHAEIGMMTSLRYP